MVRSTTNTLKKILVVDDDPDILEAVQFLLDSHGYETITDSGDLVTEKIRKEHPDLVLLDILLSGKDGRDVCQVIKKEKKLKKTPVILFSAHASAASSVASCGADDFIAKPFEMDDLLTRVAKYVS